jgi:hypothetical protein
VSAITALTFYACPTAGCPGGLAPRQLRELIPSGVPLHHPAQLCGYCGESQERLGDLVELEDPEVGRALVEEYVASGESDVPSVAAAEAALAEG